MRWSKGPAKLPYLTSIGSLTRWVNGCVRFFGSIFELRYPNSGGRGRVRPPMVRRGYSLPSANGSLSASRCHWYSVASAMSSAIFVP